MKATCNKRRWGRIGGNRQLRQLAVVLLLIVGCEGLGAEEGDAVVELERLEVLAEREDPGLLAGEEWSGEAAGAAQLGALLEGLSGVRGSGYGAGANRPVLRGMGGRRVGITQGGLGTGDLSAGSPDHAVMVEPLLVEGVEVLHGAAAVVSGNGAIGGSVDVRPWAVARRGQSGQLEAGMQLESVNDGVTSVVKAGGSSGGWNWRAGMVIREQDSYKIPGLARTEAYDRSNRIRLPPGVRGQVGPNPDGKVPNTQLSNRVAALGLGKGLGRHYLSAHGMLFRNSYGVPLDGHTHGNPYGSSTDGMPSAMDGVEVVLEHRSAGLDWSMEGESAQRIMNGKIGWTDYLHMENEGRFPVNRFRQRQLEGQLSGHIASDWLRAQWGLNGLDTQYSNHNISYFAGRVDEDRLSSSSRRGGAYWLQQLQWSELRLETGVRWERETASRQDRDDLQRSTESFSWWTELTVPLWRGSSVAVGGGRVERIPTAEELFIEAPHGAIGAFIFPQPQLRKERARVGEARLQQALGPLQLSISVFERRIADYIYLSNLGFEVEGLTAYQYLQEAAAFEGGELEVSWRIHSGARAWTVLQAGFDRVRGTSRTNAEPLPRMPADRIALEASGAIRAWLWSLRWEHYFEQTRVPRAVFGTLAYESRSAAYDMVSAWLERRIDTRQGSWRIRLSVTNLLDEEARPHVGFLKDVAPLPGRNWLLSVNYRY